MAKAGLGAGVVHWAELSQRVVKTVTDVPAVVQDSPVDTRGGAGQPC